MYYLLLCPSIIFMRFNYFFLVIKWLLVIFLADEIATYFTLSVRSSFSLAK